MRWPCPWTKPENRSLFLIGVHADHPDGMVAFQKLTNDQYGIDVVLNDSVDDWVNTILAVKGAYARIERISRCADKRRQIVKS